MSGRVAAKPLRWGLAAFAVHTLFVMFVLAVDARPWAWTLHRLHEGIVDWHASELWWRWVNTDPSPLQPVVAYLATLVGSKASLRLLWPLWYLIVGGIPYLALGLVMGRLVQLVAQARHARLSRA
jgi:hypothetical protein